MTEKWRLIELEAESVAHLNMSVRPAITRTVSEGKAGSTLVIATFEKECVGISYYNDAFKDVDIKAARKLGISFKRGAIGGGGSLYISTGMMFCLLYLDRKSRLVPQSDELIIMKVMAGVADEFSNAFKVPIRFRPLNDGEIWDFKNKIWKKLIPSSIAGVGDAIIVAVAIQVTPTDVDIAQKVITPPSEKFIDKQVKSVSERIGSFETAMEKAPSMDELGKAVRLAVEKNFNVAFYPGELTPLEKGYSEESLQLYDNDKWLYNRSELKFGDIGTEECIGEKIIKVPGGPLLRVTLVRHGDRLRDILFTGSLHASPNDAFKMLEDLLGGIKLSGENIRAIVEEFYQRDIKTPMITKEIVSEAILMAAENSRKVANQL